MNSGIYKWTNKITNSFYIGQAIDLEKRAKQFISFDKPYSGEKINEERKKYPSLKFWNYDILEECEIDKLNELEEKYINQCYNPHSLNIKTSIVPKPKITKNLSQDFETKIDNIIKKIINKNNTQCHAFLLLSNIIFNQKNIITPKSNDRTPPYNENYIYDTYIIKIHEDVLNQYKISNTFYFTVLNLYLWSRENMWLVNHNGECIYAYDYFFTFPKLDDDDILTPLEINQTLFNILKNYYNNNVNLKHNTAFKILSEINRIETTLTQ